MYVSMKTNPFEFELEARERHKTLSSCKDWVSSRGNWTLYKRPLPDMHTHLQVSNLYHILLCIIVENGSELW